MTLLSIKNLSCSITSKKEKILPLYDINLTLSKNETLAIVGESGSGKSLLCLSLLQILPSPPISIETGEIIFKGQNLLNLKDKELQKIRGKEISMIFQEPMTALNPVFTIGEQIVEMLLTHENISKKDALDKAEYLFERVKIPFAKKRLEAYPHELSGGMRQRVMIAMALSCNPLLLLADEPTTALDLTTQAEILTLIKELKEAYETTMLLVSHDLGLVAQYADNIAVLYAGEFVEKAPARELFSAPKHPYTQALLATIPILDKPKNLTAIKGHIPQGNERLSADILKFPELYLQRGCNFAPRCTYALKKCFDETPPLFSLNAQEQVRCWLHEK